MRKSRIGNPCVECSMRMSCSKSLYDRSACGQYVRWKQHHENYIRLKRYGYKVAMSKNFGHGWMTISESLKCSEEDFDSWIKSLSEPALEFDKEYIRYLIGNFYRWSNQKDPNIEGVIKKYGI
jgi:hypothetical protein